MASMGRKLLPSDNPITAGERFAWVVRAIRASSVDPDIRNTAVFTQKLNSHLSDQLQPASVNRLETGTMEFTLERCLAYESALGIRGNKLVDAYIWFLRHRGLAPKTHWAGLKEVSSSELELLIRLAQGERLEPLDWLHLAYLYKNRPDLIVGSRRLSSLFVEGMIQDMGKYYETAQRIMREPLIVAGDDNIIPVISEAVTQEPIRFFNVTEALGFINGSASWSTLSRLQTSSPDIFAAPGILDSIVRKARLDAHEELHNGAISDSIKAYCISVLDQTGALFIIRESGLAALRELGHLMKTSEIQRLRALGQDLRQLDIIPSVVSQREVVEDVLQRFRSIVESSRESDEIPLVLPGLRAIVHDALFSRDRVERISNAVLLTPWTGTHALVEAVGQSVQHIPSADYGTRRSMVRFATKLGTPNLNLYLRRLVESGNHDISTKVSIAWALGAGSDGQDEDTLRRMYESTSSSEVKRAICTAAMRRGFKRLLTATSRDRDGIVARESIIALSLIGDSPSDTRGLVWSHGLAHEESQRPVSS